MPRIYGAAERVRDLRKAADLVRRATPEGWDFMVEVEGKSGGRMTWLATSTGQRVANGIGWLADRIEHADAELLPRVELEGAE